MPNPKKQSRPLIWPDISKVKEEYLRRYNTTEGNALVKEPKKRKNAAETLTYGYEPGSGIEFTKEGDFIVWPSADERAKNRLKGMIEGPPIQQDIKPKKKK